MTDEIRLVVPWIPPESVRGNSRKHWRVEAKVKRNVRLYGYETGKLYLNRTQREDLPMLGWLKVWIDVYSPREIDGDNLLIGYKSFLDGLGPERRTQERIHPGAKLLSDDRHIKRWTIEVHKGPEKSVIYISQLEGVGVLL